VLHRGNFGVPAEEGKFKGTMTLEDLAAAEKGEPVVA